MRFPQTLLPTANPSSRRTLNAPRAPLPPAFLRRTVASALLAAALLVTPAISQPAPDLTAPLPQTKEMVEDLFGDQARLYFSLPYNYLVFSDKDKGTLQMLLLSDNERNDLLTGYLRACDRAHLTPEGQKDEGTSIKMGDRQVTFKVARRDKRAWVVLYVSGPGKDEQTTRFAVPQAWDLKDPKMEMLYGIKSGFEGLLIKSAL